MGYNSVADNTGAFSRCWLPNLLNLA